MPTPRSRPSTRRPLRKCRASKAVTIITGPGKELFYAGDEIVALAAETEEQAHDALCARSKSTSKFSTFSWMKKSRLAAKIRTVGGKGANNLSKAQTYTKGDVAEAYKTADAVVEGSYGANVICHQCLEPHGVVAEWDADGNLTVYASTQATYGIAGQIATKFEIPPTKVKIITHHMGGGYGSKFNAGPEGEAAIALAKKTGRPVKMMLDRADEITVGGNRPSAFGKVKIAGKKDGSITAFEVSCYGTPGFKGGATVNFGLLPYVYLDAVENIKREHFVVFTNGGLARAMRAPGHPQNCILTEFAVEELAAKLGLDPLVVRRKNLPPNEKAGDEGSQRLAQPAQYALQRPTRHHHQGVRLASKMARARQGTEKRPVAPRHRHGDPYLGRLRLRRRSKRMHSQNLRRRLRHGGDVDPGPRRGTANRDGHHRR